MRGQGMRTSEWNTLTFLASKPFMTSNMVRGRVMSELR